VRFYNSINPERTDRKPAERCRLYGLLCWFNAVVQERLRYTPMGWTKKHEFSEADTNVALNVVDQWIDGMAEGRANVDPADLPWAALRKLLSESLFGGRIDHPFDQDGLDSFITSIFTPKNYNNNAVLATEYDGTPLVTLPSNLGRHALEEWIKALPDTNSPSWIGLPITAESQLKIYMAQKILSNLSAFGNQVDSADMGDDDDAGGNKIYQDMCERWIAALPQPDSLPDVNPEATTDASSMPLERYFARECVKGRGTIKLVLRDLNVVRRFAMGEEKTSNHIRDLMGCMLAGRVPPKWLASFTVSVRTNLGLWIADLSARLRNLERYRGVIVKSPTQDAVLKKISGINY
jgi:dynein heavy chain 1